MGSQNQVLESFNNAAGVALSKGMIIRGTTGVRQTLLAQADTLAHLASVIGVANNPTGPTGLFFGCVAGEAEVLLETGLTPVGGQVVYVSSSVAGRGTTAPPALPVQVGTIIDASQYSNTGRVTVDLVAFFSAASVPQANWDPALCRYWFIDNELGSDSAVGYIDATPGTIFAAGAGAAVALKTSEELRNRMPRYGGARLTVALFKPRSDNGNYLNKAGANDYLDAGYGGYGYIAFKGSNDFTNSLVDRIDLGGVNDAGALGPNIAPDPVGSWTVSSQTNFAVTVAAGTLPAQDALAGLKVKYAGNVTAGLLAIGNVVLTRSAATIFDIASKTVAAANLDQFFFQAPGVKFTTVTAAGAGQNGPIDAAYMDLTIAGMRFTAAVSGSAGMEMPLNYVFCRFDAVFSSQARTTSPCFQTNYLDEAATARNVFCSADCRGAATIRGGRGLVINFAAFHAATSILFATGDATILNACYSLLRPDIQQVLGSPYINNGSCIGTQLPSVFRPTKLVAGVRLLGGKMSILAVDLNGAASGITATGDFVDLTIGYTAGSASPTGTTTGSAFDISTARQSRVVIESTSLAGTPDITMAGGITTTLASLSTSPQIDTQGNIFQNTGGGVPVKKTVLKFSGAHVGAVGAVTSYMADPGTVAAGAVATIINYPMPACRLRNLRAKCSVNALGTQLLVQVFKNNAATAVVVAITAGSTANFSDLTNEVQFTADDEMDIRLDSNAAGVATALLAVTVECY